MSIFRSERLWPSVVDVANVSRPTSPVPPVSMVFSGRLLLSLLTLLALLLTSLAPAVYAQEQQAVTTRYMENDELPVLTLTSSDPEGMGVHWDITGIDADDFTISQQGVLIFRKPPDFEAPTDREMLDDADSTIVLEEGGDNEYLLVVHAIEVRRVGETRRALSSSRDVIVSVKNSNEPGTVTLDRLQPEVGSPVTATLTDGAGIDGDATWRWYTSKVVDPDPSYENHWTAVDDADTATYTPRGDRIEGVVSSSEDPDTPVDEGRHLRVIALYTDGHGVDKRAIAVSAHPVRAEVSSDSDVGFTGTTANGSPGFSPALDYDFSLPENSPVGTAVGRPVVAVDPNDDILTYELDDNRSDTDALDSSGDVGAFSIEMGTGQIEVASGSLNYEDRHDEPYRFFVRPIDPSGETAEVEVTVSLTDVNDPPVIGGVTPRSLPQSTMWADEQVRDLKSAGASGLTAGEDTLAIFSVTDEDARGQVHLRLEGEDGEAFLLADVTVGGRGGLRALRFDNPPDYEEPDDRLGHNIYRVTLVATDSVGAQTRLPLTVLVDNVPQGGGMTVKSSGAVPLQPEVGEWFHASLTDGDGEVAPVTWQWSRAESDTDGTLFQTIPGATGPSYMPTKDDSGYFLRVSATYIDSTSDPDDPRTTHLDERVQKLEGSRVMAKVAGDSRAADRFYRVSSTSPYAVRGGSTEQDDGVTPAGFAHTLYEREVTENAETGTIVGEPVRVRDHTDSTTYELTGPFPPGYFTIDRHGQIRVGAVPVASGAVDRVPAPSNATPVATTTDPDLDYERESSHTLTVRAAGDSGVSVTTVNVRLKDLNEAPHFDRRTLQQAQSPIAFPERVHSLVVADLTAVEPDGDGLRWGLAGPDARSFTVDGGRLAFRGRPDFEQPGSAAGASTYSVTVVVTELSSVDDVPLKSAKLSHTIEVTNRNDPGVVDFSLLQPEVGTPLTARPSDVDGPISDADWTWYLAKVASPVPGQGAAPADLAAQSETYTPTEVDEDRYLLARVSYRDALGDDNVALAMTGHTARPDVSDAANNAPAFSHATVTITVPESLAVHVHVGLPVAVDMNVDGEVLTYDLDSDFDRDTGVDLTGDVGFFAIDRATGQLSLKRTLSHEATDGRDHSDPDSPIVAGTYTLTVRATDPSGEAGGRDSDTVAVKVVATDANDGPVIHGGLSELTVHELDSSMEETDSTRYVGLGQILQDDAASPSLDPDNPNVYEVSDDDDPDTHTWPEPILGPDGGLFEYSGAVSTYGRRLHFRSPPDYEDPQDVNRDNVYELILRVVDGSGAAAEKDVRVTVLNVNEAGSLSITLVQPVAGEPATATLTDPDGIVAVTS